MMRSAFRKLIEALEERHKRMAQPSQVIAIVFVEPDGSEIEAQVATDTIFNFAGDFVCRRGNDEITIIISVNFIGSNDPISVPSK